MSHGPRAGQHASARDPAGKWMSLIDYLAGFGIESAPELSGTSAAIASPLAASGPIGPNRLRRPRAVLSDARPAIADSTLFGRLEDGVNVEQARAIVRVLGRVGHQRLRIWADERCDDDAGVGGSPAPNPSRIDSSPERARRSAPRDWW